MAASRSFWQQRWLKPLIFLVCLGPLFWLLNQAYRGELGPNPIETITHTTGDWTLWLLLLSLAITPVRRLLGQPELIRFRRMLGLFSLFYAVLHLVTWAWLDKLLDTTEMWADVTQRRFITVGMLSLVLMIPLGITSTKGWIRRLGGRNWQRLHRLVYLAAIAGVVHYYWLVKSDVRKPLFYGAVLLVLLALRFVGGRTPQPKRPAAPDPALSSSQLG